MSVTTTIEWTDHTWNPTRGCTKISPGCKHCYAEAFAERWRGVAGHAYEQGFDPREVPDMLAEPLKWRSAARRRVEAGRARTRVFVDSMSDLFHDAFHLGYVASTFAVMGACPEMDFQVLTKRPERARDFFRWTERHQLKTPQRVCREAACGILPSSIGVAPSWPLPNVWLGVSVEDRRYGVPRIDALRRLPAAVRFLSAEPLLEDLGELDLTGIHQVIVGAESRPSGRKARPMKREWVRSLRDQCARAGVAFFFKQDYGRPEGGGRRRKVSLPVLDGRRWAQMPGDVEAEHAADAETRFMRGAM